MCGIAGIWNISGTRPEAAVSTMLDAMRHRGPDGRGTLSFEGGAAGMVRLALVDLSDRGQQPFWSPDRKVALIYNGEMYNFREERERLTKLGYVFHSTTDTEVILNLYLEQGLEFVRRVRGMFGLALFDWRQTTPGGVPVLILARGPLGIKPLYIAQPRGKSGGVVFASELRGLLASGVVPKQIDREALADYLAHGFVLQPRTMIEGVRMLEPGTLEIHAPDKPIRSQRYYHLPEFEPRRESLDEAAERLRAELEESVTLHAMADAPIGAFLSGGIDSTGIVALMRRHVSDLRTYTLLFPDLPGLDESREAEEAAKAYDCRHTMVELTGAQVADLLPQFADDLDQPSCDGLNTWLISQAAARDVKGVLSGVGGDEWFAGYPVTRRMARYETTIQGRAHAVAGQLAYQLRNLVPNERLRERLENLATRRSALTTWIQGHSVFRYDAARKLVGLPRPRGGQEAQFAEILSDVETSWRNESPVGLSCLLDTRVYLTDQLLRDADAASMAHSLELRVPLVDLRLVQFSRTCADEYKLRADGGSTSRYEESGSKRVLIHALRDVLPKSIADRPKRGFALPYVGWMKGPLAPLVAETCSVESVTRRGLIDPRGVAAVWAGARDGAVENLYPRLWGLMILELWCRAVLDRPAVATAPSAAGKF